MGDLGTSALYCSKQSIHAAWGMLMLKLRLLTPVYSRPFGAFDVGFMATLNNDGFGSQWYLGVSKNHGP